MNFFYDTRGDLYPTANIRRIIESADKPADSPVQVYSVEMDDDRQIRIYANTAERLRNTSASVIPAQPGTYVLHFFLDEDGPSIGRDPVIGWSAGAYAASPVVLDIEFEGMRGNMAYLFPDGTVHGWAGESWASLEEWSKAQQNIEEQQRAVAADRAAQQAKLSVPDQSPRT